MARTWIPIKEEFVEKSGGETTGLDGTYFYTMNSNLIKLWGITVDTTATRSLVLNKVTRKQHTRTSYKVSDTGAITADKTISVREVVYWKPSGQRVIKTGTPLILSFQAPVSSGGPATETAYIDRKVWFPKVSMAAILKHIEALYTRNKPEVVTTKSGAFYFVGDYKKAIDEPASGG
ncbi:MAG: hypothetical protein F6K63_29955 [Moorea sp. SIO1G6]|uniref:hypothetical protein n=1 Tax=Moorena sp. SIO1G6 TaxID=2607840 RepID=UPI0013C22F5E|nr:hypothetical protein [Moorena sp. SIO1G6]NET68395.1 hypothetical protein [Moorena sp. SIO1G6]